MKYSIEFLMPAPSGMLLPVGLAFPRRKFQQFHPPGGHQAPALSLPEVLIVPQEPPFVPKPHLLIPGFGIPLSPTTWVSSIGNFDKKSFFSTSALPFPVVLGCSPALTD